MNILKLGSYGAQVELLQLALGRAGYGELDTGGKFEETTRQAVQNFQTANGLTADAIVGAKTHRLLLPYYLGFLSHSAKRGDSYYKIASDYGTSLRAIETANPELDPLNLKVGDTVIVPLPFDLVPTKISYGSSLIAYLMRGLVTRYPFLKLGEFGRSVMGKPLYYLTCGTGEKSVFLSASYHANEWITTPVLLKFTEDLCKAYVADEVVCSIKAEEILKNRQIYIAPAINPDAIDLVTYELQDGTYYNNAVKIAENYPDVPFPDGWKANIAGIDLNLQFPAEWEHARDIKFAQGYVSPAPRDYVGTAPLTARESLAVYNFAKEIDPILVMAYHTQGEVIFWKYLDLEPENSRSIVELFSRLSGYWAKDTPYASSFAGFKDWFIGEYNRPGYTIEAGKGVNPLPIDQFDKIYADNKCMLEAACVVET